MAGYDIAVVGATGAVGREMLKTLEERRFPVRSLRLLASPRSAGQTLLFQEKPYKVEVATPERFAGCQIALFSAGGSTSKELAPKAWEHGCVVVDNSSAWRMDPDCPLVVPEVNPHALDGYAKKGIIGNPNCSTIQMVVALKPLHDAAGLQRVVVATYQAASGAGQKGIEELSQQTISMLNFKSMEVKTFPHQLAFNVIPHIDVFQEDGYTREEQKMLYETRKIMGLPNLPVSATCVRVPVVTSHSEAVTIDFERPLSAEEAKKILAKAPGVTLFDDPSQNHYPLPLEAAGKDDTFVGRIRQDNCLPNTLHLWVVSDNLRKGAALNAVQIAERLIADYLPTPA
ncbi:MAG: aspartate-semialdehyde dehydrogenase [Myxococcales bacterium]|nr:aspartate-semialdehyde dehydrogenase [Myxococcales bacterium]